MVVAGTTAGTVVDDAVSIVIMLLALFMRYTYKDAHQRSAGVLSSNHMCTTRLKHTLGMPGMKSATGMRTQCQ